MGNIRDIGLGVQDARDDAKRRRVEEEARPDTQKFMNMWSFRTSCMKRSEAYNSAETTTGAINGKSK